LKRGYETLVDEGDCAGGVVDIYVALTTVCTTHEECLYLLWAEPLKGRDEIKERCNGEGGIDLRKLCKQAGEQCTFQEGTVAKAWCDLCTQFCEKQGSGGAES
jgi:hypothetical protein